MSAAIIERGRQLLLAKSRDASSIQNTLQEVTAEIQRLDQQKADLQASYARKLALASDKELAALDQDLAALDKQIVRSAAVREQMELLATEAQAAEHQAETDRLRRDAEDKTRAEEKALRDIYPKAAKMMLDLLWAQAVAARARELANQRLPEDQRVRAPEMDIRGFSHRPREVLSRERVQLWCHVDSWDLVPDHVQSLIHQSGDNRGRTPPTPTNRGHEVELRTFERVRYHPVDTPIAGRLAEMVLPGLVRGEPSYWPLPNVNLSWGLAGAVEAIEERRATRPKAQPTREVVVELVPIRSARIDEQETVGA